MKTTIVLLAVLILAAGCSASYHKDQVRNDEGDRITVGKVQKEIRRGMSGAGVIEALGSPNIVTTDEDGNETWVWDKISTERVYSDSSQGIWLFGFAFGSDGGGGGTTSASGSSGASSTTQRTLTVIVKFDENKKVRDVAYRSTSF